MEDTVEQITKLADSLKTQEAREGLTDADIMHLKVILNTQCKNKGDNFRLVYQIFRCLRNLCIQSKKNQILVLESDMLNVFVEILEILLSPDICVNNPEKDMLKKIKVTSIQFLGNFVVQNKHTQDAVWKCGFPNLFFNLMSNVELKEKDFLCMVIYNCLKGRSKLYNNENEYWLLLSVVEYCKEYQDAEWGLFIVELIITSSSFISFYKELSGYLELRTSLVEFISASLSSDNTSIPEQHILFLCEEFSTKSKCIMMLADKVSSDLEELQQESYLLTGILSVLCETTSSMDKYRKVRCNESLLKTTVELLGQKQSSRKEKDTTEVIADDGVAASSNDPSVCFERDLVRVIGNMCYKNKKIQNNIRELGGIEMLLNACNVDNQNPYIMQWAIFAIRNICEENLQNQTYIANLEKQGLAPNKLLSETQIETRLENGKIRISNGGEIFRDDAT